MEILIFGAGSLGSVVGGFLSMAGHSVALIGRDPHMSAIREKGLRITGIWGTHLARELRVYTETAQLPDKPPDLIVVCVKSYDTLAAAHALAPLMHAGTLVCSYQNGLGNAETLASILPPEAVFGARAIYGARLPDPGHAEVTVIANPTALGTWHPETPKDRVRGIAEDMDAAGLPTVYTDRIATVLWSKVAYNCALNPLSALHDASYGEVAADAELREQMEAVVHELYAVGHAEGVALEPDTAESYLELFFNELLPPTGQHYASMREDLRRGRRTEIDALNGAIVRLGEKHGIATPVNTNLVERIRLRG